MRLARKKKDTGRLPAPAPNPLMHSKNFPYNHNFPIRQSLLAARSGRRRNHDAARTDLLAFTAFPRHIWRQIWSKQSSERLKGEARRRTDVVWFFPDRGSIIRLVGAVLAEQYDQWIEDAATPAN